MVPRVADVDRSGRLSGKVHYGPPDTAVIATPDGARFLDMALLVELAGHPVRVQCKQPGDLDVLPRATAMIVAPAMFSTVTRSRTASATRRPSAC